MMLTRRRLLAGLIAAPAIVKASSLMKIVPVRATGIDFARLLKMDIELSLRAAARRQAEHIINPPLFFLPDGFVQQYVDNVKFLALLRDFGRAA